MQKYWTNLTNPSTIKSIMINQISDKTKKNPVVLKTVSYVIYIEHWTHYTEGVIRLGLIIIIKNVLGHVLTKQREISLTKIENSEVNTPVKCVQERREVLCQRKTVKQVEKTTTNELS